MSIRYVVSGPYANEAAAEAALGEHFERGELSPLDHPCVVFFGRRWYVMTPD